MKNYTIPAQRIGKEVELAVQRKLALGEDMELAYQQARLRLLNINQWQEISPGTSSSFELIDQKHKKIALPSVGDYIRIRIPGPKNPIGNGYDWVTIVSLEDRPDHYHTLLTVKPTSFPKAGKLQAVAHFFTEAASTSLVLTCSSETLRIQYYGRNEVVNTATGMVWANLRNMLVGVAAKLGFSNPQWQKLIKGILDQ